MPIRAGPLEVVCTASPKGQGLPIMGAMRNWRTTLTGNDAFQLRGTHVKLLALTRDAVRIGGGMVLCSKPQEREEEKKEKGRREHRAIGAVCWVRPS